MGLQPVRRRLRLQGRRLRAARPSRISRTCAASCLATSTQGGEIESIAGDNRTIAFYSTYVSKNLFASRIYTMDIESGAIKELTTESFAQAPTFTPDGKSIVYMTGAGADIFPLPAAGRRLVDHERRRQRQAAPDVHERARPSALGEPLPSRRLALVRQRHEFFGDVMTQSLGLVGKIVRVDCGADRGRVAALPLVASCGDLRTPIASSPPSAGFAAQIPAARVRRTRKRERPS